MLQYISLCHCMPKGTLILVVNKLIVRDQLVVIENDIHVSKLRS